MTHHNQHRHIDCEDKQYAEADRQVAAAHLRNECSQRSATTMPDEQPPIKLLWHRAQQREPGNSE